MYGNAVCPPGERGHGLSPPGRTDLTLVFGGSPGDGRSGGLLPLARTTWPFGFLPWNFRGRREGGKVSRHIHRGRPASVPAQPAPWTWARAGGREQDQRDTLDCPLLSVVCMGSPWERPPTRPGPSIPSLRAPTGHEFQHAWAERTTEWPPSWVSPAHLRLTSSLCADSAGCPGAAASQAGQGLSRGRGVRTRATGALHGGSTRLDRRGHGDPPEAEVVHVP